VQGLLAALLCLCMTAAGHAAQYHVAPAGSDSDAGTRHAPWRTIAFALEQAEPGDTVYLRAGVYREAVRLPRSGSRRNGFITLRNYPFETAVIDGSDLSVDGGEQGLITIADRSYVRIQGLRLTNFHADDGAVPMGIFVTGAGEHIQLLDNHISRIETRREGCDGNALGIAVYGRRAPRSLSHVLIRGNELERLKTGCSESLAVNGNVRDFEIADNRIHDNNNIGIDVIGHEGMAPDPRFDIARDGVIANNTVYNITSATNSAYPDGEMAAGGIYIDGGRRILVERNRVFGNDIGIELASEHASRATRDVLVRNNLIYNNRTVGLSIGGYAPVVGGAQNCRILHNTFYHNDTAQSWGGEIVVQYNAHDNLFRNNIVYANAQAVFINYYVESTAQPLDSDHNLFYTRAGRAAGQWQWRGRHFAGLENFARATGNDRGSLFADPGFVSVGQIGDFGLDHRSAAIDAGIGSGRGDFGELDFRGHPRLRGHAADVGASEIY
jgi:hypothetical protein